MPNGPKWNDPASRSSRLPKMLGESKLGTHNHSTLPSRATSAPVWQLDRNAYSSIGGNGVSASAVRCWVSGLVGAAARARDASWTSVGSCFGLAGLVVARVVRAARRAVFLAGAVVIR